MSQTHSQSATAADNYQLEISRWNTGRNVLVFAALLGIIGCIAGYITNPARLFQSYTVAFAFTSLIGLGAFFFVMVQFLTGSAWSVTMRRIMENIMITLPVGLILFIPIAIGLHRNLPLDESAGGSRRRHAGDQGQLILRRISSSSARSFISSCGRCGPARFITNRPSRTPRDR